MEDVTLIAERIADLAKQYLPDCKIRISHTIEDAKLCILEESYDLLFLDLNLNGKDGFDLLHSIPCNTMKQLRYAKVRILSE